MNLESLRNWMVGEHAVVVAPGPSARVPFIEYRDYWTIGCNRAVAFCDPTFAICFEPPGDSDCWGYIERANPLVTLTHHMKRIVRGVELGSNNVAEWLFPGQKRDPFVLGMSPFYATAAALVLGFERVGLIGVDFSRDVYNAPAFRQATEIAWTKLNAAATELGRTIVNLNKDSQLDAIEKAPWSSIRMRKRQ